MTQNKESKYIIYLDANNVYGYAMSKFLPTSGFKWIDIKQFDLNKYNSNSSKGCVLEVDLENPEQLPELDNQKKNVVRLSIENCKFLSHPY